MDRLATWERRTAVPLTALAVVFLVAYGLPILAPGLPRPVHVACEAVDLAIWVLFAADFAVRLHLSDRRWRFLRTHIFDLAVLALPLLRPLRPLRVLIVVHQLNRHSVQWTRGRLAVYVATTTSLLVAVAALAVLDAERANPEAHIADYGDALWWSVVTITTVGYGDFYPTTGTGRAVAVALMLGGIGLIGFVTGSLATWIVEQISTADRPRDATKADVAELMAEVRAMRAELAELRQAAPPAPRPPVDDEDVPDVVLPLSAAHPDAD